MPLLVLIVLTRSLIALNADGGHGTRPHPTPTTSCTTHHTPSLVWMEHVADWGDGASQCATCHAAPCRSLPCHDPLASDSHSRLTTTPYNHLTTTPLSCNHRAHFKCCEHTCKHSSKQHSHMAPVNRSTRHRQRACEDKKAVAAKESCWCKGEELGLGWRSL